MANREWRIANPTRLVYIRQSLICQSQFANHNSPLTTRGLPRNTAFGFQFRQLSLTCRAVALPAKEV